MTPTTQKAIEGILAYFNSGNALPVEKATIRGDSPEVQALRAALEQQVVEPYGHVTVSRLSQRFENHADQYTFYPAGQVPYMDNVDECVPVFTSPPPPADVPLLTDDDVAEQMMIAWGCASVSPRQAPAFARAIEQLVRQRAGLK